MTPQEVLVQAADLIERTGWCQTYCAVDIDGRQTDMFGDDAVAFCAVGAIDRVLEGAGSQYSDLYDAVVDSMKAHVGGEVVINWNDAPGRTKEEVVATLRRAAREV